MFALLVASKPDQALSVQSVQNLSITVTWLQKSVATKPSIETGPMRTNGKISLLTVFSIYEVSGEVMEKFCQETNLCRRVRSVEKISNSATWPSFVSSYSEVADRLESRNEPSGSWESYLSNWYSKLPEFQISLVSGILYLPTAVLSQTVSAVSSMRKIP
jgi:hypothetical protein